jgi:hypothetical protein
VEKGEDMREVKKLYVEKVEHMREVKKVCGEGGGYERG